MTDKSATLPSLLHGMFHAVETSERFTCERKVFEYEYISILNVCTLTLSDSGDQAADSQQQEAEETIPESSTSRYGRQRTRVLREKLCAMA